MTRLEDVIRFYNAVSNLEQKLGGKRILRNCHGRVDWPKRGVYFFFEEGEIRKHSGIGQRVVRVGTHAIKKKSNTKNTERTLWDRLIEHRGYLKGQFPGGGDHRASVFRKHVGFAILNRDKIICDTWDKDSISTKYKTSEYEIEKKVSKHIKIMPFLWVEVDDDPGPDSMRKYIEKNSIALLSNYERTQIDPPSENWLGQYSKNEKIRKSGFWNDEHTDEKYDQNFLMIFDKFVSQM